MSAADLLALRAKRADVARRAEELTDIVDQFPSKEIVDERDRLCRLLDAYDATIATLTKPRRQRR